MADSTKDPSELIDKITAFIENERELYGDFAVPSFEEEVSTVSPQPEQAAAPSPDATEAAEEVSPPPGETKVSGPQSKPADTKPTAEDIYEAIDSCQTLQELEALCTQAEVLKTDLEDTRLVFGVGNPNADLMLIGEAPGAEEDKQGEPFVGRAGQLLNKILAAINFEREDVYIANILKHRPPNNRNPKPEERERSLPFLLRQIDLVNPKLILTLGKVSTQTLLDKESSLSKMRGRVHSFGNDYELMATYHPAALLRNPKWKRPTWEDVKRLRQRYDALGGKP